MGKVDLAHRTAPGLAEFARVTLEHALVPEAIAHRSEPISAEGCVSTTPLSRRGLSALPNSPPERVSLSEADLARFHESIKPRVDRARP